MTRAVSFGLSTVPGTEVWIEYNPANLRIQRIEWIIPPGVVLRALVIDTSLPPGEQILLDRTEGQGNGTINIPGQYRMVMVTDDPPDYLDLPSNILYSIWLTTIGS